LKEKDGSTAEKMAISDTKQSSELEGQKGKI